jgi:cell division inhibitor SepF
MNLLKKFIRNDNADKYNEEDEYDDLYQPEDVQMNIPESDEDADIASLNSPARKEPEIHPATPDKVSLKLLQPKSHIDATKIADRLKDGSIVLLDLSNLEKDKVIRLIDFLAGVVYVLGGEMIKTNKSTIVVSPAGVDISSFAQDEPEEEEFEEEILEEEEVYEEEFVEEA